MFMFDSWILQYYECWRYHFYLKISLLTFSKNENNLIFNPLFLAKNSKNQQIPTFRLAPAFIKKNPTKKMKIKKRKNKQMAKHRHLSITREEIAALELLKSTGVPVIDAAQVACATVQMAKLREASASEITERVH